MSSGNSWLAFFIGKGDCSLFKGRISIYLYDIALKKSTIVMGYGSARVADSGGSHALQGLTRSLTYKRSGGIISLASIAAREGK
jgi:hypothetical protein